MVIITNVFVCTYSLINQWSQQKDRLAPEFCMHYYSSGVVEASGGGGQYLFRAGIHTSGKN